MSLDIGMSQEDETFIRDRFFRLTGHASDQFLEALKTRWDLEMRFHPGATDPSVAFLNSRRPSTPQD